MSQRRAYVFPEFGETISALASRLFPGDEGAARRLLSWNLHLVTRRSLSPTPTKGDPGPLLATDIVYVEAPPAQPAATST